MKFIFCQTQIQTCRTLTYSRHYATMTSYMARNYEQDPHGRQTQFSFGGKLTDEYARSLLEGGRLPEKPDILTELFQTIWEVRASKLGLSILIAPCDYTAEQLKRVGEQGRRLGYLPQEFSTDKGRAHLYKIFPTIKSPTLAIRPISTEESRFGWFDYTASIEPQYPNTTEAELVQQIADNARIGMNLNEYIVAGRDSMVFTGKYLDQDATWSRLPGSIVRSKSVAASFTPDGDIYIFGHDIPTDQFPDLGGRDIGKAADLNLGKNTLQ